MSKYNEVTEKLKGKALKMFTNKKTIKQVSEKLNISEYSAFKIKKGVSVYSRGNLVQVQNVPNVLHGQLKAIAKNKDMSFPNFMRSELRKIVNSYPEEYRF